MPVADFGHQTVNGGIVDDPPRAIGRNPFIIRQVGAIVVDPDRAWVALMADDGLALTLDGRIVAFVRSHGLSSDPMLYGRPSHRIMLPAARVRQAISRVRTNL